MNNGHVMSVYRLISRRGKIRKLSYSSKDDITKRITIVRGSVFVIVYYFDGDVLSTIEKIPLYLLQNYKEIRDCFIEDVGSILKSLDGD